MTLGQEMSFVMIAIWLHSPLSSLSYECNFAISFKLSLLHNGLIMKIIFPFQEFCKIISFKMWPYYLHALQYIKEKSLVSNLPNITIKNKWPFFIDIGNMMSQFFFFYKKEPHSKEKMPKQWKLRNLIKKVKLEGEQ